MSDLLRINEVGPRDGLQNQAVAVVCADKLRLISSLVDAGIRSIEVTSFVSPKAVPQMADADSLYPMLPRTDEVAYSALVPNARGLARARASGVKEIAVVLSATETMNQRNINMTLAEAAAVCADTIRAALDAGIRAKAYVAVAYECPFEGAVPTHHVLALAQAMFSAGAQEVVIADTIGAASPRAVTQLMSQCVSEFGANLLSVHFHDTRGFALANAWASIEAGIRKFDTSIGGLGGCPFAPGAAGNLATEDLVLMAEQCGLTTGIDIAPLRLAISLAETLTLRKLGGRTSEWMRTQDQRKAAAATCG
ncbi:MAG: hydroxymethylglutaryl-CoA lyase [Betaproteobacteria bacterium]|nr:hydroxymethylglutaryl-CoA lyase [Betaproteobacteria bacterium]